MMANNVTKSADPPTSISVLNEEFMEWEERDETKISLFKHCIAGKQSFRYSGDKFRWN